MNTFDYEAAAQERNRRDKALRNAAPDLLTALENMVAQYAYWASQIEMKRIDQDAIGMARNAIAKAKGEAE